jgi:hypothetical protein
VSGIKQEVIQLVQSLPETATMGDIMAELSFKMQVDAGLTELDQGKGIAQEDVEKRVAKGTGLFMVGI